ncbi:ribosomal protein S12 methylthiotransferase accessory factor [Paraburkholderia sp. BL6669N2]|nr:ribosomal protein S12 methylthiotransferase accessory factor [Paraburkholderia sp. BL6669N2]
MPDSVCGLETQLLDAGIIESSGRARTTFKEFAGIARVSISRQTNLARQVTALLATAGIEIGTQVRNGDFVVSDLSDLDDDESHCIAKDLHRRGCPSISIWRRGAETFLGPVTAPGWSACWHCARERLADSLIDDIGGVADDPAIARAVADNVILAIRYPDVAGYGCLVAKHESTTLHAILPMPWCATCGGKMALQRWAPINHSMLVPEAFRALADRRAGVVRQLFVFSGDGSDTPALPICASALMAQPARRRVEKESILQGEGKGSTQEEALLGAIGEGVERYAASLWNHANLTKGSFNELGDRAFDPAWLVLYDREQYARSNFAFQPADSNSPMLWATGHWLDTGAKVLVPAQATYINFAGDEPPIGQTTSNGLAAGISFNDAALRAVYELIERDAFILHWLAGMKGQRVDPADCDDVSRNALDDVRRLGAHMELYLLDCDTGYPTVVCLGLGHGVSWPGATIGLGTHADIDIALRKAVLEHGHYGAYMRRLTREGRHQHVRTPEDVVGSLDHGLYYCHVDNATGLDSLRHAQVRVTLANLRKRYREESNLTACVARLSACGIRTAAVDVTTPDLALAGICVVRAFGTYMQPIHFGFGYERRNNPRLEALLKGPIQTIPHPIA